MKDQNRVVVVGGGPGGLCSAMLLAARGFPVTVLERQPTIGGRSGALHLGPYTFDLGSTMLMMRFVLEEMFALAGRRLDDELTVMPVEPMYRLDFGGRALDVYRDPSRIRAELRRFAPGEEAGFDLYMRREAARLSHLYPVLQKSWPNLRSMVNRSVLEAAPHVGLRQTLHDAAAQYFADPALQLAFSFQSAYLGMSPWDCPAAFGMVPFVEHAWGVDHVRGGIHQICRAMEKIAVEHGAEIRTGTRVRRLMVADRRCTGVELESGDRVDAGDVILNADATHALLELLDDDVSLRFSRGHLERTDESCSTFMLYLGLSRPTPMAHHTFFFADDYRSEMERLFKQQALGEDMSIYVCNPGATDSTLAPRDHSALYVLALVPNTRGQVRWREEATRFADRLLSKIERRSGLRLSPYVQQKAVLTPEGWARDFEVSHGAVFGPSHRIGQMLAFRLPNQLPSPANVFLAGAGTSPGSGLPTIFESARIATQLICKEAGVHFPAPRPLPPLRAA
jgi:phytoene desaturase